MEIDSTGDPCLSCSACNMGKVVSTVHFAWLCEVMCGGVFFADWCRLGTFALKLETTL